MRNKKFVLMALTAGLSVLLCIPAFASGWQKDNTGWWYATNDNNSEWYHSGWQWIDGNNDGIAECYYFNPNGYISVNSVIDNYTVNADGAWTVNGVVQTKRVKLGLYVDTAPDVSGSEHTTDGQTTPAGGNQTSTNNDNNYSSSTDIDEVFRHMDPHGAGGLSTAAESQVSF